MFKKKKCLPTAWRDGSKVIDTIYLFYHCSYRSFITCCGLDGNKTITLPLTFLQNHYTEIRYTTICYNRTDDKLYYTVIMPTSW